MSEQRATRPPCDTCGEPATSICTDLIELRPPWGSNLGIREYEPLGKPRYGCPAHPVERARYST